MSRTVVATLVLWMLTFSARNTNTVRAQSDFAPIEVDSNSLSSAELANVIGIRLPPNCPTNATDLQVPNVPFTILPSDSDVIVVLTTPTNLVTTRLGIDNDGEENLMAFEWNPTLAELEGSSLGGVGVIIQIPDAQFQKFYSCCNTSTQIFEGFTQLVEIVLTSGSNTQAILSSDSDVVNPSITISDGAQAVMERDLGFNNVVASSGSVLGLQGDIWGRLEGSTKAAITLKGSLQSGASSSSLKSAASLVTTTSDDCDTVQVTDGATCTLAEDADTLQVSAALGGDLALDDDGSRKTCIPRPVPPATSSPGSSGGSSGGGGGGSTDGTSDGSPDGSTGGTSGGSASSGSATFATPSSTTTTTTLFFGLLLTGWMLSSTLASRVF